MLEKDIAHVAMEGDSLPHDMLPGTEGDSDNQNVPPSNNSTFLIKENMREIFLIIINKSRDIKQLCESSTQSITFYLS